MGRNTSENYHLYSYEGPVTEFGRVIANNWSSTTYAPTEKKARCNFAHQFKVENNMVPSCKITMQGKIKRID
jgi:hypothetical protein